MHPCACATGGAEAALVGEEAIPDYGDAVDHGLAGVLGVGLGDPGDVQGDEGVDPEVDGDVVAWCWR